MLEADWKYQLAAERAVELIGEASTRLPTELRERHPDIPWREIIAIRNRLILWPKKCPASLQWKSNEKLTPRVKLSVDGFQVIPVHVRVDLRGGNISVT